MNLNETRRRARWIALGAATVWAAGLAALVHAGETDLARPPVAVDASAGADPLAATTDDERRFRAHVLTLSNLFFEGRAPGTRGGELAAEYIEWWLKHAGLMPAFGGAVASEPSMRQPFAVSGEVRVTGAEASWTIGEAGRTLRAGEEFNVLGVSGNGAAAGPLAFVGYSIVTGPDDYSSFGPHDDLKGKIAIVLRYEPMTADGTSAWQDLSGWTHHASLLPKLRAVEERGAVGIVLVNPPGAKDPRAERLETAQRTRFGSPVGVPVIMLSNEAADALVKQSDAKGRALTDLRKEADAPGQHAAVDLGSATLAFKTALEVEKIPTWNVAGIIPGRGALADRFVIIGAHYDHLGFGHFASRGGPDADGRIHPGADDNASGTAGALLLAERLKREYDALPEGADARSVLIIAFSAEESGLIGSRKFVENLPPVVGAASRIDAMINMDMIGRAKEGKVEVGGVGTAEGFAEWLAPHFAKSGLKVETSRGGQGPSDHASFYQAEVPVLFFYTGLHEQYHAPTDVADLVNVADGARIANLAGDIALAIAQREGAMKFQATGTVSRGTLRGVSVRLGIAPGNYADDQPGVAVGEVYPETSAALAGIRKGDRLIRWGGEELADVGSMMERLGAHKPGDIVEIVVVRDGKEIPFQVKMLPRQTNDK